MAILSTRFRKKVKRTVRGTLQYLLRKLDEPSAHVKTAGAPAAKASRGKVTAKPGTTASPSYAPAGAAASPRPNQPLGFSLVADEPVDIGCVKVFRAENFPNAGPTPWLDRTDAREVVAGHEAAGKLMPSDAEMCRKWIDDGYLILPQAIPSDVVDATWAAYEEAVKRGAITLEPEAVSPEDPFPGRFLNPHFHVAELDRLLKHPTLLRTCELLLGRKPIPFQTITSHKGSQQGAHSDSIHMTTYPVGYLAACWIAMEDIHLDSGPLSYFPGSHRAPYLFAKDVGISFEEFRSRGYAPYHERYEPAIRDVVRERNYPERFLEAKKGDVLFWHANLVHGGSVRKDLARSRKAVVCHYYAEGCVCYHDLSGSPSHVHGPVEKLPVCGAHGN